MSAQHNGPSGAEMAARRKAKGWTQRQLAEAAGVGRTAVQYWEAAPQMDPRGWAVGRMAEALGWYPARFPDADARAGWTDTPHDTRARDGGPVSWTDTHPRGDGLIMPTAAMQAWADRAARRRVRCGAKTRKGTPCRNKSEPGKRRCKFHGGMSTGARTPEGIERIREAQRRRWAKLRDQSASASAPHQHHDPDVTPDLQDSADAST